MLDIEKTPDFKRDLVEIWHYTHNNWGEAQANKYLQKIEICLSKIAQGKLSPKPFIRNIYFIRCDHHFIFVLAKDVVVAVAAFHEKMDHLTRMKKRLGKD